MPPSVISTMAARVVVMIKTGFSFFIESLPCFFGCLHYNRDSEKINLSFVYILHKEIQGKGQKSCVLILGTVAGHQQEQQDDQKIPGVKILRQKLFQEIAHTGV